MGYLNLNSPTIQRMIADGTLKVPSAIVDDNGNVSSPFVNGPMPTITTESTPDPTDSLGRSLLQQNVQQPVPDPVMQQQFNPFNGYQQQFVMPQQVQQQSFSFNPAMGFPIQQQNPFIQQQQMMQPQIPQQQGYVMWGGMPFPAPNYGFQQQVPVNNFQFGQQYPQQPQMGFGFPSNIPPMAQGYFQYNPYMANSQTSVYETQRREQRRQQTDIWMMCAESATHYLGIDMTEEELREIFDPEVREKKLMEELNKPKKKSKLKAVLMEGDEVYVNPDYKKKVEEEKKASGGYSQLEQQSKLIKENPSSLVPDPVENFYKMYNLHTRGLPYNLANVRYVQSMISIYDQSKQRYPDEMGLYDFFDHGNQLWIDMLEREEMRQYGGKLDILYDSEQFRQGIRSKNPLCSRFAPDAALQFTKSPAVQAQFMAANGRPMLTNKDYADWTGISFNPDLGCLEVTVPERIRKHQMTYGEARNHFLDSITRQGGVFDGQA